MLLRFPSSAHAISMLALLISLGSAGYSATGGNFILGQTNSATNQTRLVTPLAGQSLNITNNSTAAGATALGLVVRAGRPPMAVNSTVKVSKLNADLLDGLDASAFVRVVVRVPYSLAPNAVSTPIAGMPLNKIIVVSSANTTEGDRFTTTTILFRTPSDLQWRSDEQNHANIPGELIARMAVSGTSAETLRLEVNSANSIRIRNKSAVLQTGVLELMW